MTIRTANGKPIIETSNKSLRNMKEAVVTSFHESYHQKHLACFGDIGTERPRTLRTDGVVKDFRGRPVTPSSE